MPKGLRRKTLDQFMQELDDRGLLLEVQRICRTRFVTIEEVWDRTGRSQAVVNVRRDLYEMLAKLQWSPAEIGALFGRDQATIRSLLKEAPPYVKSSVAGTTFERILIVLECQCSSFCLDNDKERRAVASIITKALEKGNRP